MLNDFGEFTVFSEGELGAFLSQFFLWYSQFTHSGYEMKQAGGLIFGCIVIAGISFACAGGGAQLWKVRTLKAAAVIGMAFLSIVLLAGAEFGSLASSQTDVTFFGTTKAYAASSGRPFLHSSPAHSLNRLETIHNFPSRFVPEKRDWHYVTRSSFDQYGRGVVRLINFPGSWHLVPGAAHDIGIGADGTVWVIGTNPVGHGDSGIYRWDGSNWSGIEGGGIRIAVDPQGAPWVVNARQEIYQRVNNQWSRQPGAAHDIGIGADGTIWVIGTNPVGQGDYGIYRWDGTNWSGIEGGGVRIAVDPQGAPWVVNARQEIYQRVSNQWRRQPGAAHDIGIGADGTVWVIGTNPVGHGDYGIYRWDGTNWSAIDGGGVGISVSPSGNPWVVNANKLIFKRS